MRETVGQLVEACPSLRAQKEESHLQNIYGTPTPYNLTRPLRVYNEDTETPQMNFPAQFMVPSKLDLNQRPAPKTVLVLHQNTSPGPQSWGRPPPRSVLDRQDTDPDAH